MWTEDGRGVSRAGVLRVIETADGRFVITDPGEGQPLVADVSDQLQEVHYALGALFSAGTAYYREDRGADVQGMFVTFGDGAVRFVSEIPAGYLREVVEEMACDDPFGFELRASVRRVAVLEDCWCVYQQQAGFRRRMACVGCEDVLNGFGLSVAADAVWRSVYGAASLPYGAVPREVTAVREVAEKGRVLMASWQRERCAVAQEAREDGDGVPDLGGARRPFEMQAFALVSELAGLGIRG
ncbi:hypothetical protein ACFC1T_09145 [Kitasatospora sp. NPDC056076]|uniref:hypothetical protein n=1 Tax=Kitasatospora sp. NPDC056076 TaxID=3345703 RepID=UPI0035DD233B